MSLLSLTILVLAPLIAAIIIGGPWFPNHEVAIRRFAKGYAGFLFIYSLFFLIFFNPAQSGYQFSESFNWIQPIGIKFSLGLDGLSLILVILTTFLVLLACIASKFNITKKHKLYYSLIFILTSAILGVFASKDLFLFFLFWELELIPMYLLIAIWGSGRKEYSAIKFVLYTFLGSIFMLASILAVYFYHYSQTGVLTFDLGILAAPKAYIYPLTFEILAFLGFFIAFAVKLPVVPFHTWLPDAHVDAPTPISMLLAGILLKMGGYGLIRMNLQILPEAIKVLAPILVVLGVINIIYAALIALVQEDLKKLVAYSSISHMGIVLLGLGALNIAGVSGAVFQMIAHGVISAGLFMIVGVIYLRTHTRIISDLGGLGYVAPRIFYFSMIIALASLGLPLLIGFAAETLTFYGAFISRSFAGIQVLTIIAAIGVILTAAYLLWMLQRVFFGTMFEKWKSVHDITPHEIVILLSLVLVITVFGLFPRGLTNIFIPTINSIISNILA